MKYLFIIATSLLLGWYGREEQIRWENSRVIDSGHREYSCAELREAMRHHGIFSCKQDENYKWYFIRDGKKVYVFKYKERPNEKSVNHRRTSRKDNKRSSKKQ